MGAATHIHRCQRGRCKANFRLWASVQQEVRCLPHHCGFHHHRGRPQQILRGCWVTMPGHAHTPRSHLRTPRAAAPAAGSAALRRPTESCGRPCRWTAACPGLVCTSLRSQRPAHAHQKRHSHWHCQWANILGDSHNSFLNMPATDGACRALYIASCIVDPQPRQHVKIEFAVKRSQPLVPSTNLADNYKAHTAA